VKTIRNADNKIKLFIQQKGGSMTTSKYLSSVCYGLALGLGLFTAYVDSRGGPFHLFVTGLLLAFFGAILGFLQSQRVWRWALIIGGCVYIVFLTRRVFDSLSLNLLKAVPTFIPAFFAHTGIACRHHYGWQRALGDRTWTSARRRTSRRRGSRAANR
jgi:hypothetical protein